MHVPTAKVACYVPGDLEEAEGERNFRAGHEGLRRSLPICIHQWGYPKGLQIVLTVIFLARDSQRLST